MEFLNQKHSKLIGILILIFINLIAILLDHDFSSRILRLFDSVLFLTVFIYLTNKRPKLLHLLLFVFFVIPDICAINYDNIISANILSSARMIRHILMIMYVVSQLNFKKISATVYASILVVTLLNIYLTYVVIDLIKTNLFSLEQYFFMIMEGVFMLIIGFLAAIYSISIITEKANQFMIATFAFIFSDILYVLALYVEMTSLYYLDRILYIVGFVLLIKSITNKENDLIMSRKNLYN
ncbi:hypothetical protein HNV08_05835 [Winogradskyella eckloniae]|uniref:hypothetical protein n=1 Tax=Winogradskyella eckloniae TaxID=1089306 RepID=UPI001563298D|nr:hypothetical protein [Winogradskyella eckloniae]NRD19559.1 hypothetical protein [Winogradskyella eckloniae]